jgi:F-type H+-transporting ATPase subunit b
VIRRGAFALVLALAIAAPAAVLPAAAAFAEEHEPAAAAAANEQPGAEHGHEAEGEGEHGAALSPGRLALQVLNFAVLVGILVFFGGKAINKALLARHQQLKADLASAAAAREAAQERLRKNEARLAGLEKEIADMRAGIKQEAEVEKTRLIAAAEERAKRMREETAFVIDQQVKEAQATLRREAADGAVRIAEELVRGSFGAEDQRRLTGSFLADVAGGDVTAGPGGGAGAAGGKAG